MENTPLKSDQNNLTYREKKVLNNFSLRSEAVQEIVNQKGNFVEQRALLLFIIIVFLITAGSWFIRYPDIINARAKLIAEDEPKEIIPLQTGRLIKLFVKNNDEVLQGQMIGWIETTARTENIIALSDRIDRCSAYIEKNQFDQVPTLLDTVFNNLGELQTPYQAFMTAFQQYNDYWINGFYRHKKQMLTKDKADLKKLKKIIGEQKELSSIDRDSARVSLEMYRYLLSEKVIAPEEFRLEESKYLSKEMALPQQNQNMISNETLQREKQKEIDQLVHDEQEQKFIFVQALQTFQSNVKTWLQQYTLRAPLSGKIIFTIPLQQYKFVESGNLIAWVNPPESRYYAEITLPQTNFGKIDTGMHVQLRFDAYPYQETGFVPASISYITPVPLDSNFVAIATLSGGLITSSSKPIQYKSGLHAQALIIAKDMRLPQRIYYNIVKSLSPK